ncbi:hypothetical protein Ancab_035968 [Ancistrocladus abbreviatus]
MRSGHRWTFRGLGCCPHPHLHLHQPTHFGSLCCCSWFRRMLLPGAKRLFHGTASAMTSKFHDDTFTWNIKITSCFKRGEVEPARKLFEEMPQRNVVSWNCMISGLARNHLIAEARKVFDVMPGKNSVSWTAMLSGYIGCGNLEEARSLFDRIPGELKNGVCWDVMLNGYVRNGRVEDARELLDEAPWPSVSLCNRMLSGYVQMGRVEEAYELFKSMPRHDVASWTTMITCFAKMGLMEMARNMFEDMPFQKDVTCWTAMIQGFMQNGMVEEASSLFYTMPHRDIVAWNCMISGLVQDGKLKEALDLYEKMPRQDIVSSNSILCGFVREGDMISARNFFENVMPHRDVTSWNTLISGYETEEVFLLYAQLLRHRFRPDQATYASMISVCGALALQGCGKAIHLCVIKSGYASDAKVVSSLISMYSKCGQIIDAAFLFESMEKHDAVSWNAMILAQAYHGTAKKALELLFLMIQAACKPNHVTFLAILTVCAHWGLVEEGLRYFRSMVQAWNIVPRPEHYACMVDLLGRSGLLYEAYELVKELPVEIPAYPWETLLNCSKIHGNYVLGELVGQKILCVRPSNAEMNVLLSNIYAAKGLWAEAASVRTTLKHLNAKKDAGCSWIELGGAVYKFVYNDRSHPQTEQIYREVMKLSDMVKKIG